MGKHPCTGSAFNWPRGIRWFLLAVLLYGAASRANAQIVTPFCTVTNFPSTVLSGLVQGIDGNFYGIFTSNYAAGGIFKITPDGAFSVIYNMSKQDGIYESSFQPPLIDGGDGNFYATAAYGGASYDGDVFAVNTNGTFSVLYSFTNGTDGRTPRNGVVRGNDGNFYGTTAYGGTNLDGTIFKLSPTGNLTTLYSFSGPDGYQPNGLTQGNDGNFYGTCMYGGANSNGTVFSISPSGDFTNLLSFDGTNGETPSGALVQGDDGNFYGNTEGSLSPGPKGTPGTVFKVSPVGNLSTIISFSNTLNGQTPVASLAKGSDGDFYGTAYQGGMRGAGTLFKISPSGLFTLLYTFSTTDNVGNSPAAPLIQANDGNFYGAAFYVVYKLSPAPTVTTQPQNQSTNLGGAVTLSVVGSNAPPLTFQWQFDGTNIPGATGTDLTITGIQPSNAGYYSVIVSNANGASSSVAATLSISNVPIQFVTGNCRKSTNGAFSLQLTNLTGQGPFVISASTDLFEWTPLLTNPSAFGVLQLSDTNASAYSQRFYSIGY